MSDARAASGGWVWRAAKWAWGHVALLLIVGTFALATLSVARRTFVAPSISTGTGQLPALPPDAIVIRIAHWQLEAGFRDAVDALAKDYREKVNPKVFVIQNAIPEGIYGQWCCSQLLGGTAPDIMAPGLGLQWPIWVAYMNRYFIPLGERIKEANPHNKGSDLEGVPLFKTYNDSMRAGYVEDLRSYYGVPLYSMAVRLFYNEDLLKKLTGADRPPADYREFLALCDRISAQRDPNGLPYVAIVGSNYHAGMWEGGLYNPLTWTAIGKADINRDGYVSADEFFLARKLGLINFEDPAIHGRLKVMTEVVKRFQPGWLGLGRDEGVFLFAQQRAVFIPTGTWDAHSLQEQGSGQFKVKVMPFPYPSKSDPEYGSLAVAPPYDRPNNTLGFAITRGSKHPDIAFDFLRFMASQKGNQKFNDIVGWIPAVLGTKPPEFLEGFKPQYAGQYGIFTPALGGQTDVLWNQKSQLLQIGSLSVEEFLKQYGGAYGPAGQADFDEMQRNAVRSRRSGEQYLACLRHDALAATGADGALARYQYVQSTASRQMSPVIEQNRVERLAGGADPAPTTAPYDYSPELLARVRSHLKSQP